MPRVLSVDPRAPAPHVIAEAAAVLARGGLVAFPTETVYGLGARGLDAAHVEKVFAAKERPAGHPLILHVDGEPMATALASSWTSRASRLARAFWPGPLTLIVPRAEVVPDAATGGLASVGVRAPSHPVALALIRAVGAPLAAPSANAHMHVSPTTAAHVVRSLGERVDLVLDAGPTAHGIESTVLDLTDEGGELRVLRAGALSVEALRQVEPGVAYDPRSLQVAGAAPRASPGLAHKHYAPRARVVLVDAGSDAVSAWRGLVGPRGEGAVDGDFCQRRVVLLAHSASSRVALAGASGPARVAVWHEGGVERESVAGEGSPDVIVLPASAERYAQLLYAALHALDEPDVGTLVVEGVPDAPGWEAVADRLRRASAR